MDAQLAAMKREAREKAKVEAKEKLEIELRLAAGLGELYIMRRLINEGARPDGADAHGWTSLHFACMNGHLKTAKWLVELARATPNLRDSTGATALFYAACNGHLDIVAWLVEGPGLLVDEKSDDGRTPMHVAREQGQAEVMAYFSEWLYNMSDMEKRMKNIAREEERLSHAASDKRDVIVKDKRGKKQDAYSANVVAKERKFNSEHAAWQEGKLAVAKKHHDISRRDLGHRRGHDEPPEEGDELKKLLGMGAKHVDFEHPAYKYPVGDVPLDEMLPNHEDMALHGMMGGAEPKGRKKKGKAKGKKSRGRSKSPGGGASRGGSTTAEAEPPAWGMEEGDMDFMQASG
mmetsp:Transcript_39377/g.106314  ORF Transcript_39377/g.106314 Transcript_39377/m.106314 type:complete len:347 (-) Transcript_39377:145-1185(-)